MKPPIRFISNALLPIGCGLVGIMIDYLFHNLAVNALVVMFVLLVAALRVIVPEIEAIVQQRNQHQNLDRNQMF